MRTPLGGNTTQPRPDLLSKVSNEERDITSILATLEQNQTKSTSHKSAGKLGLGYLLSRKMIWIVGVVTVSASLWIGAPSFSLFDVQRTETDGLSVAASTNFIPNETKYSAGSLPATESIQAIFDPAYETQAALIQPITETETAFIDSPRPSANSLLASLEQSLTPVATPVPAPKKSQIAKPKPVEGTGANAKASKVSTAPSSKKANTNTPAKVSHSKTNHPATKNGDTDVALLTELVAASKGGTTVPSLSKSANTTAQKTRDIVERTPEESTASLLARCKRLGFLEGELCRWRICTGHGNDPLCAVN